MRSYYLVQYDTSEGNLSVLYRIWFWESLVDRVAGTREKNKVRGRDIELIISIHKI